MPIDHEKAIKRSYTEWEQRKDFVLPTLEQQQIINYRSNQQLVNATDTTDTIQQQQSYERLNEKVTLH